MTEHFLTEIEIKEFKCFTDFKAAGFKRVNLIGGKNNIGKTALMEACYIHVHSTNIATFLKAIHNINFEREAANILYGEFKNFGLNLVLKTKIYETSSHLGSKLFKINYNTGKYNIKINEILHELSEFNQDFFQQHNHINIIGNFGWSNAGIAMAYIPIQRKHKQQYVNELIREFDNSIESFDVFGGYSPECEQHGEWRKISEFGDGLKSYITMICALYTCENGYLFIDEIDNGIYYEHFDRLWEIILTLSKQTNCQVFATTHSKEMLESFARVANKLGKEDIAHQDISYTLLVKNKKQELKTISFDYEMLEYSMSQEHEVR